MMTLKQRINELITQHGSLRAVGRVLNIDPGYLLRLSTGEKDQPSERILKKLKLRQTITITYEIAK